MVKYLLGTRDTALELRPRKGPLHVDSASDSDWAGCPTTRKSTSGAMVWLSGALVISPCRTQELIALSSPEAEYSASTVRVAEAKFVQSILLDRGETAETEHFCRQQSRDHTRAKDWPRWHATHGDQILVDTRRNRKSTHETDQGQLDRECDVATTLTQQRFRKNDDCWADQSNKVSFSSDQSMTREK